MNNIKDLIVVIVCIVLLALLITIPLAIIIDEKVDKSKEDVTLIKVNDSIKIEVDKLDSIKNAKVIEVQELDNDSTIKLFYRLIK